jgi:hypothetical protein
MATNKLADSLAAVAAARAEKAQANRAHRAQYKKNHPQREVVAKKGAPAPKKKEVLDPRVKRALDILSGRSRREVKVLTHRPLAVAALEGLAAKMGEAKAAAKKAAEGRLAAYFAHVRQDMGVVVHEDAEYGEPVG